MTARWYAVEAIRHREFMALHELGRSGLESFLPVYSRQVRHAGKTRTRLIPLLGSYLFARFDPATHEGRKVWSTRGVKGVLGSEGGERPSPIPIVQIEPWLAQSISGVALIDLPKPPAWLAGTAPGTICRIETGAFAGFNGEFEAVGDGVARLWLSLFGRRIKVELPAEFVVPV